MNSLILATFAVFVIAAAASAQVNPGLMNIREIQPSAHLGIHGPSQGLTLYEDEIVSWLEASIHESDFGAAAWSGAMEDSLAFLDVNVHVVPQGNDVLLTSIVFQVLRPGFVLDVPPENAVFDVPVMQTLYTLSGDEEYLRSQLQMLIRQFVDVAAQRIREHNPQE